MFCNLQRELRSRNLNRCNRSTLDKSRTDHQHAKERCRFLLVARDSDRDGLPQHLVMQ